MFSFVFLIVFVRLSVCMNSSDCHSFIASYTYGISLKNGMFERDPAHTLSPLMECASQLLGTPPPPGFQPALLGSHHPVYFNPSPLRILPATDFVITGYVRAAGAYDPLELAVLQQLTPSGGHVLEVGANTGTYSVPIAEKLGESGRLIVFEPFRVTSQFLAGNIAINGLGNVKVQNFGVGSKFESVTVQAPSFKRFSNLGAMRIKAQQKAELVSLAYEGFERIDIVPLDGLDWSGEGVEIKRVDMLKIDVEGMEIEVIAGARSLIARDLPIIYAEDQMLAEGRRTFVDSVEQIGYQCAPFAPLAAHHIVICEPIVARPEGIEFKQKQQDLVERREYLLQDWAERNRLDVPI